jgi:hypothetical protein
MVADSTRMRGEEEREGAVSPSGGGWMGEMSRHVERCRHLLDPKGRAGCGFVHGLMREAHDGTMHNAQCPMHSALQAVHCAVCTVHGVAIWGRRVANRTC